MQKIILLIIISQLVSAYDICGDRECGETESSYLCENDGPSGSYDLYCDNNKDGICDRDCIKTDPDCEDYNYQFLKDKDSMSIFRLVLGITTFVLVSVIIFVLIKKFRQSYNEQG